MWTEGKQDKERKGKGEYSSMTGKQDKGKQENTENKENKIKKEREGKGEYSSTRVL